MKFSDKKKNILLLVGAVVSPFLMVAFDWSVFKETSVYEVIILPFLFEHWSILIPSYLIFLMWPSWLFLSQLSMPRKRKFLITISFLLLLTPFAVMLSFYIGMGVKNVYP